MSNVEGIIHSQAHLKELGETWQGRLVMLKRSYDGDVKSDTKDEVQAAIAGGAVEQKGSTDNNPDPTTVASGSAGTEENTAAFPVADVDF